MAKPGDEKPPAPTPPPPPKPSGGGGKGAKDARQAMNQFKAIIGKNPTTKLLAGVGSGWVSGMITVRAGRLPVALLGTSIILFQAAQNQGLIKHTWGDVTSKASQATEGKQTALSSVRQFAAENPAFTAGFTGGFLIGLTC